MTRCAGNTRLFDAYVAVDWSANSEPCSGERSIWIGRGEWRDGRYLPHAAENPSTRHAATRRVKEVLAGLIDRGCRVLVGFDFPYGYPAGFAAALAPGSVTREPPWQTTWRRLPRLLRDDERNRNNRFEVAARLNAELGSPPGPFWGCPPAEACTTLLGRCGAFPHGTSSGVMLSQYRHTEEVLRRAGRYPQETWKLYGAGSVGSQALVGITRLASLRWDGTLEAFSMVWPFETGFAVPALEGPGIVHAEIWPRVISSSPTAGQVVDEAQVVDLARWMSEMDERGSLGKCFERPAGLTDEAARACEREEGWILGAGMDEVAVRQPSRRRRRGVRPVSNERPTD